MITTIIDGEWIVRGWKSKCGSHSFKTLLASGGWLIWKTRCSMVFNRENPNWEQLGQRAIDIVVDMCKEFKTTIGKLIHHPFNSSLSLFTNAVWTGHN